MNKKTLLIISICLIAGYWFHTHAPAKAKVVGYSVYDSIITTKALHPGDKIGTGDIIERWVLAPQQNRYSRPNQVLGKTVTKEIPADSHIDIKAIR